MKKFLFIVISAILTITLYSCEKSSDVTINNDRRDFYYVKYQISGKSYFYIDQVSYNTETGTHSENFSAARSF